MRLIKTKSDRIIGKYIHNSSYINNQLMLFWIRKEFPLIVHSFIYIGKNQSTTE